MNLTFSFLMLISNLFRKEKQLLKDMNDKFKEQLGRRAEVFMHHKRLKRLFCAFLVSAVVHRFYFSWICIDYKIILLSHVE